MENQGSKLKIVGPTAYKKGSWDENPPAGSKGGAPVGGTS